MAQTIPNGLRFTRKGHSVNNMRNPIPQTSSAYQPTRCKHCRRIHSADIALYLEYRDLARDLGIEVPR